MPKISIIIINYNTPDLVYDCLKSIEENLKVDYEIIIVDNGSKSDLRIITKELRKRFPTFNFQLLTLQTNFGFGGGNNLGAKMAKSEVIWFLNSDTLIPKNNSIDKLIDFLLKNEEIAIISPLLYNDIKMQKLQANFFAHFQNLFNIIVRSNRFLKIAKTSHKFFKTDMVVGASMFIKRSLFEKLAGFDKNIFMFFDDDDLCFRAKKAGFDTAVFCRAKIIHLQGKSIKKNAARKRLYYQSQNYFWQKHYGTLPTLLMRILRFPLKIIMTI